MEELDTRITCIVLIILEKYNSVDIRLMYRRINVNIFFPQSDCKNVKILLRKKNVKNF